MKVPGGEARRVRGKWVFDVTRDKHGPVWDVFEMDDAGRGSFVGQWPGTPEGFVAFVQSNREGDG